MKMHDWLLSFVEAGAWYGIAYTFLYSIKHDVNLYVSSLLILVLMYVAGASCPVIRHLQVWKDLWKE